MLLKINIVYTQLIARSLSGVVSTDTNLSLVHYFAALHIAYEENKAKIAWFSQLVSFNPGIMVSLKNIAAQVHRSEIVS